MAGRDYDDFIDKYNAIAHKLSLLEKEYQLTNPNFEISPLWTCYCLYGQIEFNVTEPCCEPMLKAKMLAIFNEVL